MSSAKVVWRLPRPADGLFLEQEASAEAVVWFQRLVTYQAFNRYYKSDQEALAEFMEIHSAWFE